MIKIHLVGKRPITNKPTAMPDSENSRKKLLPINPNSLGDSDISFIIGTADRPNTSLSKKFSVWNRNSMMRTAKARLLPAAPAVVACNGVIVVSPCGSFYWRAAYCSRDDSSDIIAESDGASEATPNT